MSLTQIGNEIMNIEYQNSYTQKLVQNTFQMFRYLNPLTECIDDLFKWIIIYGPEMLKITEQQMHMIRHLIVDIINGCLMGVPIITKSSKKKDEWKISDLKLFLQKNSVALGQYAKIIKKAFSHFKSSAPNPTVAYFISFLRTYHEPDVLDAFLKILKN